LKRLKVQLADFLTGIGKSAAILLAQKGAKVAINDLDAEKAHDTVEVIRKAGNIAHAFPGNILDESYPQKLIDDVLAKWKKVNCLINNAGTGLRDHSNGFGTLQTTKYMGRILQ
jgi:NAD(P)-dependent dehydrogenase (short-subunit alcohol dehydrogenase family)